MRTSIKLWTVGVVLAVGTLSSLALAGLKSSAGVTVKTFPGPSWSASGSMSGARYSASTTEYIGCETQAYLGEPLNVSCWAITTAPNQGTSCQSTDPNIVAAAGRINPSSYIEFTAGWDAAGMGVECRSLVVRNTSDWIH